MQSSRLRIRTAVWYGVLLWIAGFVWGTIVFMAPTLKGLPSIEYVSKYPAISAPLMIFYLATVFFLAKRCLKSTDRKASEGLKLGAVFFLLNIVLDIVVYVVLFQAWDYFSYVSIWLAYAILVAVPLATGRWLKSKG